MKAALRLHSTLLNTTECSLAKSTLPTWNFVENKSVQKHFTFKDFKEAWEFMKLTAKVAEQHDHHPEWTNVFKRVEVRLTTHSAGGLTLKDVWLAKFMDQAESIVKHEHDE